MSESPPQPIHSIHPMPAIHSIIDPKEDPEPAKKAIMEYGDGAEHHYWYYMHEAEESLSPRFVTDGRFGILGLHDSSKNVWKFHAEPLAPKEKRAEFLHEVSKSLFSQGAAKITVEIMPETRKELMELARKSGAVKVCKVNYELEWPVYDLSSWDGDGLQGSQWKDMRNYLNNFRKNYPNHSVVDARSLTQKELHRLVVEWKKNRAKRREHTPIDSFKNAINCNFEGFAEARAVVVDGKPVALTAGFSVIHTKPQYYSAIGIYNPEYGRLGEFANWDDLCNLKKKGYRIVDFGGGDDSLNAFKRKFHPTYTYKTQIFSLKPGKQATHQKSNK